MVNIWYKMKAIFKMVFTYFFYLPGLILHEGSHAIMALITFSTITSVKLIPSIKFAPDNSSYSIVYGFVKSIAVYRVAYILIGLAPLFLWLIPLGIADYCGWIGISPFYVNFEKVLKVENWWFILLLIQIAWAGFPSSQDWKVTIYGLFSLSSFIFFGSLAGGYFFILPTLLNYI